MNNMNTLFAQLQQYGPEFLKDNCLINGSFWALEQLEKMGLDEFTARTFYSVPLKFYKYFPDLEKDGKNYSVQALESNEVYLSTPNDFDDVFDSEINVSWSEFEAFRIKTYARWAGCQIAENMTTVEIANVLLCHIVETIKKGGTFESAFNKEGLGEVELKSLQIIALRLENECMRNSDLGNALRNAISKEYNEFVGELKNKFRIACFTTTPMSQLMWGGSYANQHKGFCLEYTVVRDKEYEDVLQNIRPVIYSKTRRSVTRTLLDAHDKNWDIPAIRDLFVNGVLRKSIDWAYQNEWRLLMLPKSYKQQGFTTKFFPITKVYLGNRMSPERRKDLIAICKRKGIPYVGVTRAPDRFEMQECNILCENCPNLIDLPIKA